MFPGTGSSHVGPTRGDNRSYPSSGPASGGNSVRQPGGASKEAATSSGQPNSIPHHLSFIVQIEPLSPDYTSSGQRPRETKEGYFSPPDKRCGYKPGDSPNKLFRWTGGRLYRVAGDDGTSKVPLKGYGTATVFTQLYDTPHLLAVPFDARKKNVRDTGKGWRRLTFDHERIPDTHNYYSFISYAGSENVIAAPGSAHWMPQLLPDQYRPRTQSARVQAGLIGELPLLIALAAFSTPPTALDVLLTSLQPGAWNPLPNQHPSGHIPERGMVVTVCLDPLNPAHSTKKALDRLQSGEYGPFYGPHRPLSVPSPAPSTQYTAGPSAATGASTRIVAGPAVTYTSGPSAGYTAGPSIAYPAGASARYPVGPLTGYPAGSTGYTAESPSEYGVGLSTGNPAGSSTGHAARPSTTASTTSANTYPTAYPNASQAAYSSVYSTGNSTSSSARPEPSSQRGNPRGPYAGRNQPQRRT